MYFSTNFAVCEEVKGDNRIVKIYELWYNNLTGNENKNTDLLEIVLDLNYLL